jgi:hypothetical protein
VRQVRRSGLAAALPQQQQLGSAGLSLAGFGAHCGGGCVHAQIDLT